MSEVANATRTEVAQREPTRGERYFTPRVDIVESDKELTLYADMPGVANDGVDLRYEKGELVLHGKVAPRHAGKNLLANEAPVGDYYRVFTIHESIDATKIEAEYKQGVLVVHLPKAESAQPRTIAVKLS
jgi:HSP20 family protein